MTLPDTGSALRKNVAAGIAAAVLLAGCAETPEPSKPVVGAAAGGAMGGLVGSQFGQGAGAAAATGAGVLVGAALGYWIGQSLDHSDRLAMQQTTQTALETGRTGEPIQWRNMATGNAGAVTPLSTTEANGTACREYRQSITAGGQTQEGYGLACRQADGLWRIVR